MTSSAAVTFCACVVTAVLLNSSHGYPSPDDSVYPLAEVKQSLEPELPVMGERSPAAVRTLPWDFQRGSSPEDNMQVEEQRYGRGYPTPYYYVGGYYPWGGWNQYGGYGRGLYYPYAYYA